MWTVSGSDAGAARRAVPTALANLAILPLLWLAGCTYAAGDPYVVITSDPAGAEVLIDGQETGMTTPIKLDLGGFSGDDHQITLRKHGYTEETRTVYHYTTGYTSRWIDGATDISLYPNPLWWTFGDWFTPFALKWRFVPHELYVTLHEEGKGPVRANIAEDTGGR